MRPHKINVSYRLTDDEKKLVELLAKHSGMSETDVVKQAIRKFAKEEGIKQENSNVGLSKVE
jgi:predicted transcriptional regulator